MKQRVTLKEAQETGKMDEFIRQQEKELGKSRGVKYKILGAIKRMARSSKSDD